MLVETSRLMPQAFPLRLTIAGAQGKADRLPYRLNVDELVQDSGGEGVTVSLHKNGDQF
jgi:hypothetical protein